MATAAPIVLTSQQLSQREARSVVMISAEEILRMRTVAYTGDSKTEFGWLLRQPSAASILQNDVEIQLDLQFTFAQHGGAGAAGAGPTVSLLPVAAQAYGRQMEGLPFQTKCVRTATVSCNGASMTYRPSEYLWEWLKPQVSRACMEKIGGGWNEYTEQHATVAGGGGGGFRNATYYTAPVESKTQARQAAAFKYQMTSNGTADFNAGAADGMTVTMTYTEPLCLGFFGALMSNESFPAWSNQQNVSPAILHANQLQINLQLLDNWKQNLFGMIQHSGNQAIEISDVTVMSARLNSRWVMPPPRMIASALSAQVSYAVWGALRFQLAPQNAAAVMAHGTSHTFDLSTVAFPYMPNVLCFSISPDYNLKQNHIAAANASYEISRLSKLDQRISIKAIDLIINTSADGIPKEGGDEVKAIRYNARELYKMTLKNCGSVESFPYTFEEWFRHCPFVLISSDDINGITNSMGIRGQITLQGKVYGFNQMGYDAHIGTANPAQAADPNLPGVNYEKFQAQVVGFYTNKYLTLDSKSGMVGEAVLSESFGQSLRLAGGGNQ